MALINCKECGKEISDQAKSCPHCGMPLKKKGKGFAVASLVLGIIGCVYTLPAITAITNPEMPSEANIAISVYIMIFGILALIFGFVSHRSGCKLKKKTAGIILGTISVAALLLCIIISVL